MNVNQQMPQKEIDSWSVWTPLDRSLYEGFYSRWNQHNSYEANFAYIQQECRDRAWKFFSDEILVTACVRGDASEFAFVLPPIGSVTEAARRLPDLCAQLADKTGRRVIIRKLQPDLHATLSVSKVFRNVPLETYKNPRELPEDIYPQIVAQTRFHDRFVGKQFVKLRNQVKTAHRSHQIHFHDLTQKNSMDVKKMIRCWANEQNVRLRSSKSSGKAPVGELGIDPDAYTIFCDSFSKLVDNELYFGRVMEVDGKVVAFCFAGRTSNGSAALYASLCQMRSRGLADCMIVDMMNVLALVNITNLNFGGSEGLNLFNFKNKWGTVDLIETNELEYVYKKNEGQEGIGK